MSAMFFIYFLCSTTYISIGLLSLSKNRTGEINRIFFAISLNLSFWAMTLALMSFTDDSILATLFRRIAIFSWGTVYAQILFFVLKLTHNKYIGTFWAKILLLSPAIVCILLYFFDPISVEYIVRIPGSWAYLNSPNKGFFWNNFFTIYYVSYMLLSIILLFKHSRKTKLIREKKQAKLIYLLFLGIAIIASITDILLPILGIAFLPPLTITFIIFAMMGILYSIYKYGLMNISTDRVIIEVSKKMSEGVLIFNNNNQIIDINQGAKKSLGYNKKDLEGDCIQQIFTSDANFFNHEFSSYECDFQTCSGNKIPVLVNSNFLTDDFGDRLGTVINFQDMTEIRRVRGELIEAKDKLEIRVADRTKELVISNKELKKEIQLRSEKEKEIKEMAFSDYLTGLPNRRMFSTLLKAEVSKSIRTEIPFAILFIDLDGFKLVNDSIGHANGDHLLIEVAHRLKKALRQSDLVSRIGGDEFSIILYNPGDLTSISLICQKLINVIKEPYYLKKNEMHVSASMGIAIFPIDGMDDDTLLKNADIAMYHAKERGKGRYAFYNDEMNAGLEEMMRLTNDLYRALDNDELELYYQPQVLALTGKITGFEALLRWNHPKLGLVMPGKFIGIAERTGLIKPIGNWVLKAACLQLTEWNLKYNTKLNMAVNLSIKQLDSHQIVEDIKNIIFETAVNPELIELEITESSLMKDIDNTVVILNAIKEYKVKITIDDFGTEYSSLNYIKHLAVSRIKIPKTFIDGIKQNKSDESIIASTILLAKELGMNVVAEGVEENYQYTYLKDNACGYIQGYYFHKPMPTSKIDAELKKQQ